MQVSSTEVDQVTIISIAGSVDALTAGEVTDYVKDLVNGQQNRFVADLSQLDYMSSAGLRAILAILKESRQHGGDLRLAAVPQGIEKLLKMASFTSILKIFPSVDLAVASFSGE